MPRGKPISLWPNKAKRTERRADSCRCEKSPTKAHWWRIERRVGECRYCGERREFAD
jgi:hypothetical protein